MTDLADEFSSAVCSLTPRRIDWLRGGGIPDAAIFHEPLMVGVGFIEIYGGGLFEPRDDGPVAVLVPCGTHDGINWDLEDIVAFKLEAADRWWRRLGAVPLLGEENLRRFRLDPLQICAGPLDWLRSGGRGACVLDWRHDPVDLFLGAGEITADLKTLQKLRKRAEAVALSRINRMFANG